MSSRNLISRIELFSLFFIPFGPASSSYDLLAISFTSCVGPASSAPIAPPDSWITSLQRNGFNFDGHTLGQLVDCNASPGRLVRKPLLILAVHLCEVGHVGNEDLRSALQMSAY
jgi:hypothetical protein